MPYEINVHDGANSVAIHIPLLKDALRNGPPPVPLF